VSHGIKLWPSSSSDYRNKRNQFVAKICEYYSYELLEDKCFIVIRGPMTELDGSFISEDLRN
jgi:hypothetical protein